MVRSTEPSFSSRRNRGRLVFWLLFVLLLTVKPQARGTTMGINPEAGLFYTHVTFSPDAKRFALVRGPGVELWSTQHQRMTTIVMQNVGNAAVNAMAFSPNGSLLACGRPDGTALLWKCASGEKRQSVGEFGGVVTALAFSPKGDLIAGGCHRSIDLTPQSGTEQPTHEEGFFSFYPQYKEMGDIGVRNVRTNQLLWSAVWEDAPISALAFSPDGRVLAAAAVGRIRLFDATNGQVQREFGPLVSQDCNIAFSPDGRLLAMGVNSDGVAIYDTHSGQLLHTLARHRGTVWSVAFSPDGQLLASASSDNTIHLSSTRTGSLIGILPGKTLDEGEQPTIERERTALRCAVFSHDGREVIAVGLNPRGGFGVGEKTSIQHWNIAP